MLGVPQHLSPGQGWRQGGHLCGKRRWRPDERKRKNGQKMASVWEGGSLCREGRGLCREGGGLCREGGGREPENGRTGRQPSPGRELDRSQAAIKEPRQRGP